MIGGLIFPAAKDIHQSELKYEERNQCQQRQTGEYVPMPHYLLQCFYSPLCIRERDR